MAKAYMADDEGSNEEEVNIDDVEVLGDELSFLGIEETKLNKTDDAFSSISYEQLDRNSKRKVTRLNKKLAANPTTKHITLDEINGYDFFGVVRPPYNLDYLTDLSVENSTHAACIQAKAINIVGLGYKWSETTRIKMLRGEVDEDDDKMLRLTRKLQRATDSLDDWINNLNEEEEIIEILLKVWMDVEAIGNGYLEIGRNRDGTIGYLGHVPGASVRVRANRDGFLQMVERPDKMVFFRNYGDQETADPFGRDSDPNELMHFKKHSPKNSFYGIPDIISALPAVAGEKFSAEYNLDYFENKAVPRFALIIKGAKLSATAERRILEYFKKEVKGKHHGTLYIPVPAPMGSNVDVTLQPIENKIQDGSFSKYREQNRMEIMMVHRVPPSKLAVEAGSNSASARESDKSFKSQVCRPEQRRVEKKLNRIIKEYTDMYTFKFEEYDLVDEETQSRIHDRYIRLGTLSNNEVRADIARHPRKGGDKYMEPAAELQANIALKEAQAEAAIISAEARNAGTGNTGGPPRKTLDGGKNTPGSTKTPASQSSTGIKTKGQGIDEKGPRSRER